MGKHQVQVAEHAADAHVISVCSFFMSPNLLCNIV
jgi:hypothetical protein